MFGYITIGGKKEKRELIIQGVKWGIKQGGGYIDQGEEIVKGRREIIRLTRSA